MKRSQSVTLVLIGTAALAGCNDDRTAPPQPHVQQFAESLALPAHKPKCDRPEDFSLPECHDPQNAPAATTSHTASSAGHGSGYMWWLFHTSGSPSYGPSTQAAHSYASAGSAVRAAAPAGTTSFGGFGSAGHAAMSAGGGGGE